MAKASGIRAGKAYVEIGADQSSLERGLKAAQKRLESFGKQLAAIGAGLTAVGGAATAGLVAAAAGFAEAGSALNDASARTGVSAEALSELQYAAQQTGTDLATVEGGLRKLAKATTEAEAGSKAAAEALGELGLTAKDLKGLAPEKQFDLVARRLSAITDPSRRAAVAMELLGKSGTALLPMAQDLDALRQRAQALGVTMTDEDAAAADAFGDAMDDVRATLGAVRNAIGSALAPVLTDLATRLAAIVAGVAEWVRNNQGLVVAALKVSAAVAGIGAVLTAIGGAFVGAGAVAGALVSTLGAMQAAVTGVGAALAILAAPVGIAIGALAALGVAAGYYSGAAAESLQWLKERFADLSGFVGTVVGGISDALAAGDIQLAADVLWKGLAVVWQTGTDHLLGLWLKFKNATFGIFEDVWFGAQAIWINLTTGIRSIWIKFTSWFFDSLRAIADTIDGVFGTELSKAIASVTQGPSTDQQLADLEAERQRRLAEVGDSDRGRAEKARQQEAAARMKASEKELADANAALAEARQKAAKEAVDAGKLPGRPGVLAPADLEAGVKAAQKTTSLGTFNAVRTAGVFEAGTAQDRTAKATEESVKLLRNLNERARQGRLVFTGP